MYIYTLESCTFSLPLILRTLDFTTACMRESYHERLNAVHHIYYEYMYACMNACMHAEERGEAVPEVGF